MNRIKRIVSALIAIILCLSAFSALAEDDPAVATFNGGSVLKSEIEELSVAYYYSYVYQMSYYSQMFGGSAYTPTENDIIEARRYMAAYIAQIKILYAKMLENGFEPFTDEYLASAKAEAEETFMQYANSRAASGYTYEDAVNQLFYQGITPESFYVQILSAKIDENLATVIKADDNVTEEEISERYASLIESAKKKSAASVETSVNDGKIVYYMPEGYKYVKHILIIPDDEAFVNEYDTVVTDIATYEAELANMNSSYYEPRYDAIVEKAMKEEAQENIAASKAMLEELKVKLFEITEDTVNEIVAAYEGGASFDTLIEKYSKDTGSFSDPVKTNGYLIHENSTRWDPAFKSAVDSLENVGDLAYPVAGSYGVHIVKFESVPAEGSPALEDVKEEIKSLLLSEKQSNAFENQLTAWMDTSGIEILDVNW